ncbi:hypothetical protein ScPMuIL_000712 [Solemya velum]
MVHYIGDSATFGDSRKDSPPFFRTYATLAIPNIVMVPALDEIQQAVNKIAQMVVSVSKGISQWSRDRKVITKADRPGSAGGEHNADRRMSAASHTTEGSHGNMPPSRRIEVEPETTVHGIALQPRNYFKSVSENKEVSKLASLLSTSINSTKKEVTTALDKFSHYRKIWESDRDEEMKVFLDDDPKLPEFEAQVKHYEQLEVEINSEPEYYNVGPVALYTEKLKLGLTTETKGWRLHYGKACNTKYRTEMEEIFKFLEDVTKRLSRPVKDLDDIRFAMASLKDIRENEIRIDMLIGPIERFGTRPGLPPIEPRLFQPLKVSWRLDCNETLV